MKDILHVTFISHSMTLIVVTYSFYINLYLMQLLATVCQDCKNPKKPLVLYIETLMQPVFNYHFILC
jgi:hypothetical protein